jgi:glycosyltransferase involved in cell wall biosynthesis
VTTTKPAASVIVPAYNEEDRIGTLLPVLSQVATELGYLVVVACNGCVDRTVQMARATPGVEVLELERASKPHALNEAERFAGDVFPRLYVDADVRTDVRSIERLADALRVDTPRAVRPKERYVAEGAPWYVRAYYSMRYVVPSSRDWLEHHIEGHHIYGTNAAGRAKFDFFPEDGQIMEDAFFDRMFDPAEKVPVYDSHVEVPLPSTSRALLRGMTRIYQGNWELTAWLTANRRDRLPPPREDRSGRSIAERARYLATGGSTFDSWHPRVVVPTLAHESARILAIWNARRLVRAGRQADWR